MNEIDDNEYDYCSETGLILYTSYHLYYIGILSSSNSIFLVDLPSFIMRMKHSISHLIEGVFIH